MLWKIIIKTGSFHDEPSMKSRIFSILEKDRILILGKTRFITFTK